MRLFRLAGQKHFGLDWQLAENPIDSRVDLPPLQFCGQPEIPHCSGGRLRKWFVSQGGLEGLQTQCDFT